LKIMFFFIGFMVMAVVNFALDHWKCMLAWYFTLSLITVLEAFSCKFSWVYELSLGATF
jgi:hypothetical protein